MTGLTIQTPSLRGKKSCQHSELYFTDGAFQIRCAECKARWFAGEVEPQERFRGTEWIESPSRVDPDEC